MLDVVGTSLEVMERWNVGLVSQKGIASDMVGIGEVNVEVWGFTLEVSQSSVF